MQMPVFAAPGTAARADLGPPGTGVWFDPFAPGVRLFRRLRLAGKVALFALVVAGPLLCVILHGLCDPSAQAMQARMDATRQHVGVAHGVIAWAHARQQAGTVTDRVRRHRARTRRGLRQLTVAQAAQRCHLIELVAIGAAGALLAAYFLVCFHRSMQQGSRDLSRHFGEIACGNPIGDIRSPGRDEAAALMHELRRIQGSLAGTVMQVRTASDAIVHTSGEIASGARDLSTRTEQAAGSLEQSAASMEEIATTAKTSADSIAEASRMARRNAELAADGGRTMRAVVDPMQAIRDASAFIGKIIGAVNDIADACIAGAMPKSGFSANNQAKVAAMHVRGDLLDARTSPAKYANVCWSMVAPNDAVKVGASYAVEGGEIVAASDFVSSTGESDEVRALCGATPTGPALCARPTAPRERG